MWRILWHVAMMDRIKTTFYLPLYQTHVSFTFNICVVIFLLKKTFLLKLCVQPCRHFLLKQNGVYSCKIKVTVHPLHSSVAIKMVLCLRCTTKGNFMRRLQASYFLLNKILLRGFTYSRISSRALICHEIEEAKAWFKYV